MRGLWGKKRIDESFLAHTYSLLLFVCFDISSSSEQLDNKPPSYYYYYCKAPIPLTLTVAIKRAETSQQRTSIPRRVACEVVSLTDGFPRLYSIAVSRFKLRNLPPTLLIE